MAAEKVSGDAILQGLGKVSMERLSELQKAGVKIALWIGIVGTLVILGLVGQWILRSPTMPALSTNPTDSQQITALLGNYKTASELALDGPFKWFDNVIVKVLVPLFTLVLGYIFGTRGGASKSSE